MGNVSIYLPDDLHEWANEHIDNLSTLAQDAVLQKQHQHAAEKEAVKKNRYASLLLYSLIFIIGFAALVFSYIIHTSPLQGAISVSYEVILLLIIGMVLQVVAIFSLFQYRKTNNIKD
jgi:membrane protein YdbS with pleckstrin-like domain